MADGKALTNLLKPHIDSVWGPGSLPEEEEKTDIDRLKEVLAKK